MTRKNVDKDEARTQCKEKIERARDIFTARLLHQIKRNFFPTEYDAVLNANPLLEDDQMSKNEQLINEFASLYVGQIGEEFSTDSAQVSPEIEDDKETFYLRLAKGYGRSVDEVKQREFEGEPFDAFVSRFAATLKFIIRREATPLKEVSQVRQ